MVKINEINANQLVESKEMARYYHVLAVKHSNSI